MGKGQETRREIIRKAAPIFNQRGFEGVAISQLMAATRLQKGGIYRHFRSKQELAAESFDYSWKIAVDTRFAGTEKIGNSVDRLKRIVNNFSGRREGLVPGGCPLLNTAIESDDGNLAMRRKARKALSDWLGRLTAIGRTGQRCGEIRRDVDAAKMATLIVSTLEGALMLSRLQKDRAPIKLACIQLTQYLEQQVRAPRAARIRKLKRAPQLPSVRSLGRARKTIRATRKRGGSK